MPRSASQMKYAQFEAHRDEIMRLCSYITDDAAIAGYFSIPVERVRKVRASMPKYGSPSKRTVAEDDTPVAAISYGGDPAGCRALREAIEAYFERWEQQYGFKPGAAQILLPAGWSEERHRRVG